MEKYYGNKSDETLRAYALSGKKISKDEFVRLIKTDSKKYLYELIDGKVSVISVSINDICDDL